MNYTTLIKNYVTKALSKNTKFVSVDRFFLKRLSEGSKQRKIK
jgi:hypothetical protein